MNLKNRMLVFLSIILIISNVYSSDTTTTVQPERPWALGMIARVATIPFETEGDRTVGTLIPLIFYDGEIFYMRALERGFRLYKTGDWQFTLLGRLLFVDIPKDYQNEVQGDNLTVGLQARYRPVEMNYLDLELMNDYWGAWFANARIGMDFFAGSSRGQDKLPG